MRKALLSDWEKNALGKKTIDRRLKHKIERRLSTALDVLTRDVVTIAYSRHLLSFNLKNLVKWWKLGVILDADYKYLLEKVGKTDIKIETLDFVKKDGKAHYYIRNRETVTYDDKFKSIGFFHLEGNEDDKPLFDTAFRLMDRPDELRIMLSLRRIKQPYPKRILRKALKLGYRFADRLEEAVPLSSIRNWMNENQLRKEARKYSDFKHIDHSPYQRDLRKTWENRNSR